MSEKHYPYYGGGFDRIVFDGDGSVWVPEREECRMITDGDGWWECDTCGATIDWDSCDENDPPSCKYCPNCGRKVVEE